jgi:hypothetical protein
VAAIVSLVLTWGSAPGWSQAAQTNSEAQQASQSGQPGKLFITVLDGEGALNDIRTRTAREPIVEVDDENHKPVAGALVLFAMDNSGGGSPFASFAGAQEVSVTTDAAGRAVAQGFAITQRKGHFKINVHATKNSAVADAVIAEVNVAGTGAGDSATTATSVVSHRKLQWIVGGVAAAGVIIGVAIAETRSSSPTTVGTGTGTVGAPTSRQRIQIHFHWKVP